ncbi:MAG TPA: hypothetical protein GYA07_11365 [Verrucomicrobia bacterium]|nr:hypothetical protein [Verrucomicrobiota bacterium]HOP98751.1 N-acetylmuramoyl-L-alanine amidase [Verrucomicrobiota bacterium]
MLSALRLLALAVALAVGMGAGHAAQNRQVQVSGRVYVRLGDWARANQFTPKWLVKDKTLQYSNRNTTLVFTLTGGDRRDARINGVRVLLALPIHYEKGIAYISQLDLERTIAPILSPRRNAPGIKVKTICLDAGHGGKDPGFRVGAHEEQKYTLLLALELRDQLTQAGFNVVMTRTSDTYVALENRVEQARRRGADLFVSLHFNAFSDSRVQGIETYCCTPSGATSSNAGGQGSTAWVPGNRHNDKSVLLAYHVQKSLVKHLSAQDRGVKRARYQVLRDATVPAVLVEGGFMSNAADRKRILDPAGRKTMARGIVEGIKAYQRAVGG